LVPKDDTFRILPEFISFLSLLPQGGDLCRFLEGAELWILQRLALEFPFCFRSAYLALVLHSLRQVYPYSFWFNLSMYQGLLALFYISSFHELCYSSFVLGFGSSCKTLPHMWMGLTCKDCVAQISPCASLVEWELVWGQVAESQSLLGMRSYCPPQACHAARRSHAIWWKLMLGMCFYKKVSEARCGGLSTWEVEAKGLWVWGQPGFIVRPHLK
jgi:hypothetical protein